jgi:transcriptional regulator of aromatic amino acid metabolism
MCPKTRSGFWSRIGRISNSSLIIRNAHSAPYRYYARSWLRGKGCFPMQLSGPRSCALSTLPTFPAINMMIAYHWPGNVRELENCIERAVLLSSDGVIHGHHLPPTLQTSEASDTVGEGSLQDRVGLFERDIIVDALKRSGGNMAEASRDLRTTARILRYKTRHLGIDWKNYRRAR